MRTRAIAAAMEAASAHGLRVTDPVPLAEHSNLMVHLRPAPVVARVATTTGLVRRGTAWQARELAVVRHLLDRGAPVAAPSRLVEPGPHRVGGLVVSFWELVDVVAGPPDAAAAGSALRVCHRALESFRGALPELSAHREAVRMIGRLVEQRAVGEADAAMLRRTGERLDRRLAAARGAFQPLHGDAALGNVLQTADGPLWTDWEDTYRGPAVCDLACLVRRSRVLGEGERETADALAGYGGAVDETLLDEAVQSRALQVVAWTGFRMGRHPIDRGVFATHLRWLWERDERSSGTGRDAKSLC